MELEETKLDVQHVQPGMYVSRLDREWLGSGFPLQGFLVRNGEDIRKLRQRCQWVVVDIAKSASRERGLLRSLPSFSDSAGAGTRPVPAVHSMKAELESATTAVGQLSALASSVIDRLGNNQVIKREEIRTAVEPIVKSVVRQPEAAFWLLTLQRHESHVYRHAVNCSALAALLGRQLQMPEPTLVSLATGGMLFDLGLTQMPAQVREQPDLSLMQQAEADREHIERGLAMYQNVSGGSDPIVEQMLRHHHERNDGSGFAMGLSGQQIPMPARIAAIVDAYSNMVSVQPFRQAMSQHDALQQIYRQRDKSFQAGLVESFLQAMSVYPVGTLVELSSGEVGIVMSQSPTRRLRPTLIMLTDADKQLREHFKELDLMAADRANLPEAELYIQRALPSGAYGLDPTELYL